DDTGFLVITDDDDGDEVTYEAAREGDNYPSGSGTAFTVEFQVKDGVADGSYALDLVDVVLSDADKNSISGVAVTDGSAVVECETTPEPNITEPADGAEVSGAVTASAVDDSGLNVTYSLFQYYFDEDGNCVADDGNSWQEIGNDTNGSDGWSAEWDTKSVADGSYIVKATMGDVNGTTGSDEICVLASNPPEPRITNPADGAKVQDAVTVSEVDDSGQDDIAYNLFEYSPEGTSTWVEIANDTDGSDGWSAEWNTSGLEPGMYTIRATMGDNAGNTGSDQIMVDVVGEGITLTPGWNLVSVRCVLANDSVEHFLEGVDYDAIIYYDGCAKNWDLPTTIEPLQGYHIYVSSTQTITNVTCGVGTPPSLPVCEGWNAVGNPAKGSVDAETAFQVAGVDDSYSKVWNWDTSIQDFNRYGYNCNVYTDTCPPAISSEHMGSDDFVMNPYMGYWLKVTSNDTLEAIE
ncbi:MAG: hypothetical protein R6U44_12200, partial [Archaeoglobaceae archaeon]